MVKKETYLTCPNTNIFEGMTSISAILNKCEQNINESRTIVRILFDEAKKVSKSRELAFLQRKSAQYGFPIEFVDSDSLSKLTTGNTHGGIIAECAPKKFGLLSDHLENIAKKSVF